MYEPPTIEEWHQIWLALEWYGFETELEGGGAAATFFKINLADGRALAFGDNGDYWTADVYESRTALDACENAVSSVQTDVPTKQTEGDLLGRYHDPESIADGLLRAITDVCMAGAPAILGKCGDSDCVCM